MGKHLDDDFDENLKTWFWWEPKKKKDVHYFLLYIDYDKVGHIKQSLLSNWILETSLYKITNDLVINKLFPLLSAIANFAEDLNVIVPV